MATDVTQAEYMAQVEDSILEAPLVTIQQESEYSQAGGALVDDAIDDVRISDVFKHGDAEAARLRGEQPAQQEDDGWTDAERATLGREERLRREIEQERTETGAEQANEVTGNTVELTAEQFQPIVEQTHQAVKDLGMIEAPKLAADLAPYFAVPIDGHAEEIGLMVGGLTLSAAQQLTQAYQGGTLDPGKPMDFGAIAPLQAVACDYLAGKWCEFRGQQEPAKDAATLGNALNLGFMNLIHSKGVTDPKMAVLWVKAVEKAATGRDVNPSEQEALAFVNALTPHVRGAVGKFNAATAQAKPKGVQRMTSARKYDGIRTPGLSKQVKQTGNGQDAATLAVYQREHGRL